MRRKFSSSERLRVAMLLHVRRTSSGYSRFSRGVSCFGATSPSSLFVDRLSIVDHLALFRAFMVDAGGFGRCSLGARLSCRRVGR